MSIREPRMVDVPVHGGVLRVAVWDDAPTDAATVLLVHGVTSSHRAFAFLVDRLPGVRIVAPDLRGRGGSRLIEEPTGMRAHAADLAAVLDDLGIAQTLVVGHSMGAFVSVVLASMHPDRVSRLVLIDGGLPLDVPAGLDADALMTRILGPTAARLSMRFASPDEYRAFWRQHPAFAHDWSDELEKYLDYDLIPDGEGMLRPATSYAMTAADTLDMNTPAALPDALSRMTHPARFITVRRGLQDEAPGLYSGAHLSGLLSRLPAIRHETLEGLNHYTVVMSDAGAAAVSAVVREELGASGP